MSTLLQAAGKQKFIIGCVLCLCMACTGVAGKAAPAQKKTIDWSAPQSIDPLRRDIGKHLTIKRRHYIGLANSAFKKKKYKQAAQNYLFILKHNNKDIGALYNLACCYGQMGEAKLAAEFLAKSVQAGYKDFGNIKKDTDFKKVKRNKRFKDAFNRALTYGRLLGQTIYVTTQKLTRCRIHLPENYDPSKSYPLLIALHGYGSSSEDIITLINYFKTRDFIYAAPEGTYMLTGTESNYRQFSWGVPLRDENLWLKGDTLVVQSIRETLSEISTRYKINKTYIMGFSQGVAFAYLTALKYPGLFSGLAAIAGHLPSTDKSYSVISEGDIKKAAALKIFIGHSKEDRQVKYSLSTEARKKLEAYGYGVTFCDYEGGHKVTPFLIHKVEKWMGKNK
ncbi:MAG: hypothetical protein GY765_01330 [bacterium]|nr:hypothetical protein [bacterium]